MNYGLFDSEKIFKKININLEEFYHVPDTRENK